MSRRCVQSKPYLSYVLREIDLCQVEKRRMGNPGRGKCQEARTCNCTLWIKGSELWTMFYNPMRTLVLFGDIFICHHLLEAIARETRNGTQNPRRHRRAPTE
jgi:hypothetical protein